jgi:glycine/D-amino acid oxidase-like deaminating enzyme
VLLAAAGAGPGLLAGVVWLLSGAPSALFLWRAAQGLVARWLLAKQSGRPRARRLEAAGGSSGRAGCWRQKVVVGKRRAQRPFSWRAAARAAPAVAAAAARRLRDDGLRRRWQRRQRGGSGTTRRMAARGGVRALVLLGGGGAAVAAMGFAGAAPRTEGGPRPQLPAQESPPQNASRPVEARLVVVGGGIIGASLAYSVGRVLARSASRGTDGSSGGPTRQGVVLLDRGLVGSEASGLSAGTIENGASRRRDADLGTLLRFKTTRMLERLAARGYSFGLTKCGSLVCARNEQETASLRASFAHKRSTGEDVELLVGNAAVAQVEPGLRGGSCVAALHCPQSSWVDPGPATQAFAQAAADEGPVRVLVAENAEVEAISVLDPHREGGLRYEVRTRSGLCVRCEALALCPGAWARQVGALLDLDVPVVPVKGQVWVTAEPVPMEEMSSIVYVAESGLAFKSWAQDKDASPRLPMFVTHDWARRQLVRHAYGRRTSDGHVLFGGARLPARDMSRSELYEVEAEHLNQEHVYELIPGLRKYGVLGAWAGPMPFPLFGEPMVGELSPLGLPSCWLIIGFGPHGVMDGTFQGVFAAACVAGRSSPFPLNPPLSWSVLHGFPPAGPAVSALVAKDIAVRALGIPTRVAWSKHPDDTQLLQRVLEEYDVVRQGRVTRSRSGSVS